MFDKYQACVYLYRSTGSAQIRYVGRGASPDRTLQHTGGSHNEGLRALIASGNYALEVAGPYASTSEAALVEAALIWLFVLAVGVMPGGGVVGRRR